MRRADEGQSLVEFAIMVPLLVGLVFATIFLSDFVRFRLKNFEAARYAAFALAKLPQTDFDDKQHARLFLAGQTKVLEETARFRDLDWSENALEARSAALNGTIDVSTSRSSPKLLLAGRTASDIGSSLGGGIGGFFGTILAEALAWGFGALVENFGYNGSSWVEATAVGSFENHLMPGWNKAPGGFLGSLSHFTVRDSVGLVGDPWGLGDGRDVRPGGFTDEHADEEATMHKQVGRLFFMRNALGDGPARVFDALGSFSAVFSLSTNKFAGPFEPRVTSYNYRGARESGMINVYRMNGIDGDGQAMFDTTHMADERPDDHSKNIQALRARGGYFMGCPKSQALTCDYRNP